MNGEKEMGVSLPAGKASRIVIRGASEFPHIAHGLDDIGWTASHRGAQEAVLTVAFEQDGARVARDTPVRKGCFSRVLLPSPLDLPDPFAPADLVVEADAPEGDILLLTSRRVERDALYRLARGTGVEIGPGPSPQIHNSDEVQVSYIEEMTADEWLALYKPTAGREAWDKQGYQLGKAHDLPVKDGSLDFIFSSHVLEHLYNPLGHFEHWRTKLKPGGVVLGAVPTTDGTKDFLQAPTAVTSLEAEHETGEFRIPLAEYDRWVRAQGWLNIDEAEAAKQHYEDRFSIHVHVYDHATINALLRHCVSRLGYSAFRVSYKRNAKDFVFALKA